MEKVLQPYDKERMRMAMLQHEETFREQVNELHRLYRIQKMLMDSAGVNNNKHQQQRPKQECNGSMVMEEEGEGELELTLSLGPSRRRKTDKSESGQSTVSSSSTGSSQTRKTSPKSNSNHGLTREDHNQFTWGTGIGSFPHQGSGSEPGFRNGQQSSSSSSHPAWLSQALSLKMT